MATHVNSDTQTYNMRRGDAPGQRDEGTMDKTEKQRKGRESGRKTGEVRGPIGKSERQKGLWEEQEVP